MNGPQRTVNSACTPPGSILRRHAMPAVWALLLAVLLPATAAADRPTRQVLLLHSFQRDFAPFDRIARDFKTGLSQASADTIIFLDVSVSLSRSAEATHDGALVSYLTNSFATEKLDLVVAIGGPATRFIQRYRPSLFPNTPLLLAAVDERSLARDALTAIDAAVPVRNEPVRLVENILSLLPQTREIFVVVGSSMFERRWQASMEEELVTLNQRVRITYLNDLAFSEVLRRCQTLPPHSAVWYGLLWIDAAGVPLTEEQALPALRAVTNAPIFGLHSTQVGRGAVGGPVMAIDQVTSNAIDAARRILQGESPQALRYPAQGSDAIVFDFRELRRWNISEARLPAGAVVLFRELTAWHQYRWPMAIALTIGLLQASLIAGLLVHRVKRRHAERALVESGRVAETHARQFSQRLLRAQEDERARLARELHDDVTQRLTQLALDTGRAVDGPSTIEPVLPANLEEVRQGLFRLSEDVHTLAYRLHPRFLAHVGLARALKTECERLARQNAILVQTALESTAESVSQEAALCLFRIAQEALNNVVRHSGATSVVVSLRDVGNGIELSVRDYGVGFVLADQGRTPSLGLTSMRERLEAVGGQLTIESAPGWGTSIAAWLPVEMAACQRASS